MYASRGDIQPPVGLAVHVRALSAEVEVYAPPDQEFAELLAGVGVPPLPVGQPVRLPGIKATPPSATDLPARGRFGRRPVRYRRRGGRGM